jgi:hypothetical protein
MCDVNAVGRARFNETAETKRQEAARETRAAPKRGEHVEGFRRSALVPMELGFALSVRPPKFPAKTKK